MFATIVWAQKLAHIPPCYVFVRQVINGNCIFSHSLAKLANMVLGRQVGKHTPLKSGGSLYIYIYIYVYVFSIVGKAIDNLRSFAIVCRGLKPPKRNLKTNVWIRSVCTSLRKRYFLFCITYMYSYICCI